MKVRIYSSERVGDGSHEDPYRSASEDFLDTSAGHRYKGLDNPDTNRFIHVVLAPQAVHDALYGDRVSNPGRIVYLTPLVDGTEFKTALNSRWGDLPQAYRTAIKDRLLPDGLDTSQFSADTILRRGLWWIFRYYLEKQKQWGDGGAVLPDSITLDGEVFG